MIASVIVSYDRLSQDMISAEVLRASG